MSSLKPSFLFLMTVDWNQSTVISSGCFRFDWDKKKVFQTNEIMVDLKEDLFNIPG